MPDQRSDQNILSVSDLNHQARLTIEQQFQTVWIIGEMSNFARPSSGHWYFSLKDQKAQVRCAMFANRNRSIQMQPGNGQQVLIRGRVSLYEGRGEFQLIADYMEPAGEGALRQAFDQLKIKLASEGLFDTDRKRSLPGMPTHFAIVTSATGAALQDVLAVWQRRYPILKVTLVPSLVQGGEAEQALNQALSRAIGLAPDAILLTRGGGSLEDLWAFNSERLARAVAECEIPIVSAVGHEIDTTICDFVADVRAPTPSAAAELMTPDRAELSDSFYGLEQYLSNSVQRLIKDLESRRRHASQRLSNPVEIIERMAQRIDDSATRLKLTTEAKINQSRAKVVSLQRQLPHVGPQALLHRSATKLASLQHLATRSMENNLKQHNQRQAQITRMLHNLSPLPTLARGYAVVRDDDSHVVSSIADVAEKQLLTTTLEDGTIISRVEHINNDTLAP
jgi:exodeoxyribonuclease VII large subunit